MRGRGSLEYILGAIIHQNDIRQAGCAEPGPYARTTAAVWSAIGERAEVVFPPIPWRVLKAR